MTLHHGQRDLFGGSLVNAASTLYQLRSGSRHLMHRTPLSPCSSPRCMLLRLAPVATRLAASHAHRSNRTRADRCRVVVGNIPVLQDRQLWVRLAAALLEAICAFDARPPPMLSCMTATIQSAVAVAACSATRRGRGTYGGGTKRQVPDRGQLYTGARDSECQREVDPRGPHRTSWVLPRR